MTARNCIERMDNLCNKYLNDMTKSRFEDILTTLETLRSCEGSTEDVPEPVDNAGETLKEILRKLTTSVDNASSALLSTRKRIETADIDCVFSKISK